MSFLGSRKKWHVGTQSPHCFSRFSCSPSQNRLQNFRVNAALQTWSKFICNFCQPNTKLSRILSFFSLLHTPNSLLPITLFSPVPDLYLASRPLLPDGRVATAWEPSEQRSFLTLRSLFVSSFCLYAISVHLERPIGSQEVEAPRISRHSAQRWQVFQSYAPAAFTRRSYSWHSFLLEAEPIP